MHDDQLAQGELRPEEITLGPPSVEFYVFDSAARPPEPASATVLGSLPSRAVQLCAPLTDASGFGWYLFPPVDFALRWDGQTMDFSRLADNEPAGWQSLAGGHPLTLAEEEEALQRAPDRFKAEFGVFDMLDGQFSFIDADPRLGSNCEITLAVTARTPPGWSLLIRSPANWAHPRHHQVLEGVVDTEWYGAKLPVIVRLLDAGQVVRFYRNLPIAVAQPVPRVALEASQRAAGQVVLGIENFPDEAWERYAANRRRRLGGSGRGTYRAEQRRRRVPPSQHGSAAGGG
jgi:hypothetical protein